MHASLNSRVQLALLRKLRYEEALIQKGFTLVELMIVVAIVGILSAVALPRFLGARDAASLGAAVGEQVALAKECSTFVASGGIGAAPANCTVGAGGTFTKTASGAAAGIKCLAATSGAASTTVTVTVAADTGAMSCAFS